jgi:chemotaxis protein CheC
MVTMTPAVTSQWEALLQEIASDGVARAAEGFAGMLGEEVTVTPPSMRMLSLSSISSVLGGPEEEAVGVYLQAEGELPGQIILVLPLTMALELVDVLLGEPRGTTQTLGSLERSALAEVGNITGTFFLNAMAKITGLQTRPTPPAVMVDMLGAVLDVVVAVCGGGTEKVLVLQAAFLRDNKAVEVEFWVIPDPAALELLSARGNHHD